MTNKNVALEVSSFLDSPQARALRSVPAEQRREIAEAFVELCYDALGKAPRLIDAEDLRSLLRELLPARLGAKDPRAQHVPQVLAALLDHLEATQVVTQGFELRRALEETTGEFLAAVDSGRHANQLAKTAAPFVHGASKLGRNDPCSCGSGKKFKRCHGA